MRSGKIHLNEGSNHFPTYKRVRYNDPAFRPIADGMAAYKGKLYGTKEDLKYMPKFVRLVK